MIKCIVNQIEYRLFADYKIQDKLGNVISTDISIEVPKGVRIPKAGDIVRIVDDSVTPEKIIFLGVAGIPKSPVYSTLNEVRKYKIKCQNANAILRRRLANYAEQNINLKDIILELYDLYMQAEGITLGVVSDSLVNFTTYVAPNIDLQKVINELADRAEAIWTISEDRVFNFITPDDFPRFQKIIDEDYIFGTKLSNKNTGLDVRTVQIIDGSTERTALQTENYIYNGTDTEIVVSFPIVEKPIIEINSVAVDPSRIGVKGLNSNDPNFYFLFSFNSPTITYNEASAALTTNDIVTTKYIGQFRIRIEASNDSRIEEIAELTGTSGIIESVFNDSSIKNSDDGFNLANTLLANFSKGREEIKWSLISEDLKRFNLDVSDFVVGTQIEFNLPDLEIVGNYVITERTLSPFSASKLENYECKLKLQDRNLIRAYGETISRLERQVTSLSVREDEIIVQSVSKNENIVLTEEIQTETLGIIYYASDGSTPAVPFPLQFPFYASTIDIEAGNLHVKKKELLRLIEEIEINQSNVTEYFASDGLTISVPPPLSLPIYPVS